MLRVCHKYAATGLEERIISYLSPMFPHTFERFLLSETSERVSSAPFDYTSPKCNIYIANAARETGALRILPAALYRLCRDAPFQLLYSTLSPDNLRSIVTGRPGLSASARATIYTCLFEEVPGRGKRLCCYSARLVQAMQLSDADRWRDPLAPFDDEEYRGLCSRCMERAEEMHHKSRAQIWVTLPKVFALPEWSRFLAWAERPIELYGTSSVRVRSMYDPVANALTFQQYHILPDPVECGPDGFFFLSLLAG